MSALASSLLAWLLTYLIHSTVLLGIAWFVTRRRRLEPAASDLLWKVALLASLVTGTIQSRLELRTPASVRLPVATASQAPTVREHSIDPSNESSAGVSSTTSRTSTTSTTSTTLTHSLSLPLVVVLLWG